MAYTTDKKSTGLDVLTGLDAGDLHIVGDVSDSGRAKAITQNNLEIDIANSTNFVDTLVANNYFTTELAGDTNFITELQTAGISSLDVQEGGVSVETPVNTINFVAPTGTVTTPSAGVVDIDLTSLMGGGGGGGGTKLAIDTTETIVSGTVTETTLYTVSIPGGTLGTNDAIRLKMSSEVDTSFGEQTTIRIKYGGQTVASFGTGSIDQKLDILSVIVANAATNAQKNQTMRFFQDDVFVSTSATTVDSTTSQNLEITAELSSAGAGNSFTANFIIVEKISSVIDGISIVATANEDITAGDTVGVSNITGGIARAARYSTTANFGYTYTNAVLLPNKATPIGGNKFVVVGAQVSDDSLYATVFEMSTTDLTVSAGTAVAATADVDHPDYSVCKLDTDKFIVFYKEDASTSIIKYRAATVSGTAITYGSAATFYNTSDSIVGIHATNLGVDKGVVYIKTNTDSATRVIAFTTSGTVATVGTPATPDASLYTEKGAMVMVDTDKFILATSTGYAQVGTVSGTTITLGSAVQYSASAGDDIYAASQATNAAVIGFQNGSSHYTLVACTISGTVPTFGTAVSSSVSNALGLVLLSSTEAMFGAENGSGPLYKYTISGTTITFNGAIMNRAIDSEDLITLDNGLFVVLNAGTTTLTIQIEGMSNGFIGIAQSTVSQGAQATVLVSGIDTNQTGLIPGYYYIPDGSGGLGQIGSNSTINTADDLNIMKAISSTTVKI